jgi:hypothetical protein
MATKIGYNLSINLNKIDKSRIFVSNSGDKFINVSGFINLLELSQYGDNGAVRQQLSKEERANNQVTPIIGNIKVFWTDDNSHTKPPQRQQYQQPAQPPYQQPTQQVNQQPTPPPPAKGFEDDIPF